MYVIHEDNIRLSVLPHYEEDASDPDNGEFIFSLEVAIENLGDKEIQLVEREWVVSIAGDVPQIAVMAPEDCSDQPVVRPGTSYCYTSGTLIEYPAAAVEGACVFRAADGKYIELSIPSFQLLADSVIVH